MNKQFELIPMEVNVTNEVATKKKSPMLKLLKYALVGITAFLALVILFAVGAEKINPAVDTIMQKMGVGEHIVVAETSPVAYAWTNPSSNSTTDNTRVADTGSYTWKVVNRNSTLRPTTAHSGWNWGYRTESGAGNFTLGSDGSISCNTSSAFTVQTLFYVDIYVDELARAAIANGQITTCSVSLHVSQVGTANIYDRGDLYGTFFLCGSASGSTNAACNDMGSNSYLATGRDKFDDDMQGGRHDYSCSMSLTLNSNMKKIRFGIYYRMVMTGRTGVQIGGAECFAPAPTISSNFTTDTYKNGTIQFAVAGDAGGGNIYPVTAGTFGVSVTDVLNTESCVAAFDSSHLYDGTVIGNVIAKPAKGYYFSGWRITGASLWNNPTKTLTTLSLAGPYLKANTTTTVTAYFRKIQVTDENGSWNYLQELNSDGTLKLDANGKPTAIGQGPAVVTPSANSDTGSSVSFTITGGIYSSTNPTFTSTAKMYQSTDGGSHNSNSKPTNAGAYRLIVGIFVSGTETDSSKVLGYYIKESFTIGAVNVTHKAGENEVTTSSPIPSRAYSSYAYTPVPDYVDVTINSRPYRMFNSTDYTIGSYTNNVNVSRDSDAYFTFTSRGNFTGQNDAYFKITHLNINEAGFVYDATMAEEIRLNYNVVYTGFEQRPGTGSGNNYGVIALRITGRVLKSGSFTSYDPNNETEMNERTTLKTFTIYIQTQDNANAYNDGLANKSYFKYNAQGEKGEAYASINRATGEHSYFYVVGQDAGTIDATKIYKNNIDICTYGTSANCASFDVSLVEGTSNMTGSLTAYFNIGALDLSTINAENIVVTPQTQTHVYTSDGITPVPNLVQITVSGLYPYLYNSNTGRYSNASSLPITYSFARTNALGAGDDYGSVSYGDIDASKTGTSGAGQTFSTWNAYFGGTRPDDYGYANNVNASSEAQITVELSGGGNIEGTIITSFTITPRPLNEKATGFGSSSTQTVGQIAQTGSNNVVYYAGVDANGKHIPVTTTSAVYAYPDGTVNPQVINVCEPFEDANGNGDWDEGESFNDTNANGVWDANDFVFTFSNNTTVTRYAVMTVTGRGNYTGSISANYYIVSMDFVGNGGTIEDLADETYTGSTIAPQPNTLTINIKGQSLVIEKGKDFVIVDGIGSNTNATTLSNPKTNNYIVISFTGYKKDTANQGIATQEKYGNYYGEKLKVYFTIKPKAIDHRDIETYASWQNFKDQVTYTGKKIDHENLSIVTEDVVKTANTIYLRDTVANPDGPLVRNEDYVIDNWGGENDNINAGDYAGIVVIRGEGNYTGYVTINFKIYARDIDTIRDNIIVKLNSYSFEYTGAMIRPQVTEVKDELLTVESKQILTRDVDFTVNFGGESDDGLIYNVDVLKGGLVTIVGKGNYTGSKTVDFEITKKAQTVKLENPYGNNVWDEGEKYFDANNNMQYDEGEPFMDSVYSTGYNNALAPESKANDPSLQESAKNGTAGVMYADYEVNADANGNIVVVAYTDAIAPLRLVKIKAVNINRGIATGVGVTYVSLEEYTDENGKVWAKTTAEVSVKGVYGIIRIYAVQEDEVVVNGKLNEDATNPDAKIGNEIYQNRGNYVSYSHVWGEGDVYSIYAKRQDKSRTYEKEDGTITTISKVYGNDSFTLAPQLASGDLFAYYVKTDCSNDSYVDENANGKYDVGEPFTDVDRNGKYDPYIISVSQSGQTRVVQVGIVGESIITIYHDGYVPSRYTQAGDDANAYVSYSVDVKVRVNKRTLIISFEELDVPYGVNIEDSSDYEFKYTYRTQAGEAGTSEGDSYTTLQYFSRKDDINDILTGYRVSYDYSYCTDVNSYLLEVFGNEDDIEKGSLYDNYNIVYEEGILNVVKRALTVSVSMNNSAANTLSKVYGSENPTEYDLEFVGFPEGEGKNVLEYDPVFVNNRPRIVFSSVGIRDENGNLTGEYSDEVTKYSDVGGYTVLLTGGQATNYYFTDVKVDLFVTPAPVVIKIGNTVDGVFEEAEDGVIVKKVYDGKQVMLMSDNVSIEGVDENATVPIQDETTKISFLYVYGTTETAIPQTLARTYAIIVQFEASANDNYTATNQRFEGAIIIEKAEPVVILNYSEIEYTGRPIPIARVTPIISGIYGGKTIDNTNYHKLLFEKDPELNYEPTIEDGVLVYDENMYTEIPPTALGQYDMIVVYVANVSDVYKDVTVYFEDVLYVKTGIATIEFNPIGDKNFVYDGLEHSVDVSEFQASYTSQDTLITEILYNGSFTIQYMGSDGVVTSKAPVDAGNYAVIVNYIPAEGDPVDGGSATFANAIKIAPFDLATPGHIYAELLSGSYNEVTYDGKEHPIQNSEIVLLPVPADQAVEGRRPMGTIAISYVNAQGVAYSTPINAGSYFAMVTYIPNDSGDNYTYGAKEADGTLIPINVGKVVEINRAEVRIEEMLTVKTEQYTGRGVQMNAVKYYGVEITPGRYDVPVGKLRYEYRLSNSAEGWTERLPVNAGTYDVMVTYVSESIDNYYSREGKIGYGVIVIEPILPSIAINSMVFDFGTDIAPYYDINNSLFAGYVIRGAQADVDGPLADIQNNVSIVSVVYGTRYTDPTTNKIEYEWSDRAPVASGKYSVKVTYQVLQRDSSNYSTNAVTRQDCLTINNIIPWFKLETKTVFYSGERASANLATVYDSSSYDNEYIKWEEGMDKYGNYYYGTIGYEYRKQGTDSWLTAAPREVGTYDVRIRYYENLKSDSFTSQTLIVSGALEIKPLVINVMPLYGQGNVYDGSYTDGNAVAYVYSYERDGYKYMVYSRVGDLEKGEIIDISSAEYVDENGHVFNVLTDTSLEAEAWRDYYTKALILGEGSFVDGGENVIFNFGELLDTKGMVVLNASNGKRYEIDLDREIVYLNDGITYTLGTQSGYYFSEINGEGAVNVIEIDPNKVVGGIFSLNVAGRIKRYTVNFGDMTAIDENGVRYDIYRNAGRIEYVENGDTYNISIDHSAYYQVGVDGKAIYKHANGSAFLIDINTSKVERIAILKVETASFSYIDVEGEEKNVTFNVSDLTALYTKNSYIGRYQIREDLSVIVDLKAKTVRIPTFFIVKENGTMLSFIDYNGLEDRFMRSNLYATTRENVYLYYSNYGDTYYVDLENMIARIINNLYFFDAEDERIYQVVDGVEKSFGVDVREFTYNVVRGGKLYDVTTLYGAEYEVEKTTLIAGNEWNGSMRLSAQNAGAYEITQGSLVIGGNYSINFVGGVFYKIERTKLQIEFVGTDNTIYDGQGKYVSYVINGLVNNETELVLNAKQEYDGDNVNVTSTGYRTKISLKTDNYYIEGGRNFEDESSIYSDYYFIDPATMAPIVFERGDDIVYDGFKHYLELKNVERGAKVTYSGSSTAPYFVEPGIYSIIATVSKDNYVSQEVELTIVITKAKYSLNVLDVPGTLTYGDALPALRTDSQDGTVALDPGQVLLPGVTTYTWTFTPHSQEFYKFYEGNSQGGSTITGTIELKVQKAQANIQISGNLVQSETSPSAIIGIANGLSHNESELVTIEYVSADGTRYAKMPTEAGKYTVVVTYAGDEYHMETVYTTTLTIEAESNYDWLIILGGVLLGLTVLSTAFFLIRGKRKKLD